MLTKKSIKKKVYTNRAQHNFCVHKQIHPIIIIIVTYLGKHIYIDDTSKMHINMNNCPLII